VKITNLTDKSTVYTSNVYLVTGTWNAIQDVNTLVDVGMDKSIVNKINEFPTGVGKTRVEQVLLTHSHSDHIGILKLIREAFHPRVYAFSPYIEGVDHILKDGDQLKMGDRIFEVYHTPGHSDDSICLFCESDGVLIVGDTSVEITSSDGCYEQDFVGVMEQICMKDIRTIYFGHGDPKITECKKLLNNSMKNILIAQAHGIKT
jgi:glyoxylase-like metal-dependent hydrolase (beta-lactamase superfamily II)